MLFPRRKDEESVVPDKLENKINYKIILGIIGMVIVFQYFIIYEFDEKTSDDALYIFSFISIASTALASFVIAKRYTGMGVFKKAYFSLGFAYISLFLADVVYILYERVFELDPYPSIADVLFMAVYVFTLAHLIFNIRFFAPKITLSEKTVFSLLPIGVVVSYILIAFQSYPEPNFDFYYGVIFVTAATLTFSFAAFGARIFKDGTMGTVWLLLVLGISTTSFGDIWYYYMEFWEGYTLQHPVNMLWHAGYWIIVYALYKHKVAL